jgi:hypothetical protein
MVAVVVAALGVAPPTPLLPRVCGPPTSTPRLTLFRCGWVPQGGGQHLAAPPVFTAYAGRHSSPSLWSSTAGRATFHATTRVSTN